MKPMLAKRYKDQKKHVTYPVYVQPKLNGVRALYTDGRFQSRDQHLWNEAVLAHLTDGLSGISSSFILDGELYRHGYSLQQINGSIAVKRIAPGAHTTDIEYHVYDYIDREDPYAPFHRRTTRLQTIIGSHGIRLRPVETKLCYTEADAEKAFGKFLHFGYEGMMYRDYNAPYGFEADCGNKENRWNVLLKRKDWLDDWFPIINQETGTGKYSDCIGSLQMEMSNGLTFWAGSGLSDMERIEFLRNSPIGRRIHIKYEMLSDEGKPLKPTIIELE